MMEKHRLHRNLTGDGIDLTEQDPADEAMVEQWEAQLREGQADKFRRVDAGEEMGFVLHRRNVARAAEPRRSRRSRRSRTRARGAGSPRRQASRVPGGDSSDSEPHEPEPAEWRAAVDRTCGCDPEPSGPRALEVGLLGRCICCDHSCSLVEFGDTIVCTLCWSEVPVTAVGGWPLWERS
jgi:hypothetical protein